MRTVKFLLVIAGMVMLHGCATSYGTRAQEYERVGDCNSAELAYKYSDMWMGDRAYEIATIYGRCAGDRGNAIKWATLSARYDVQRARDYLVMLGAPIPAADLYKIAGQGEYTAGDAALDFLTGFNKGVQQNKTTNCTSTKMPSGNIDTTCN